MKQILGGWLEKMEQYSPFMSFFLFEGCRMPYCISKYFIFHGKGTQPVSIYRGNAKNQWYAIQKSVFTLAKALSGFTTSMNVEMLTMKPRIWTSATTRISPTRPWWWCWGCIVLNTTGAHRGWLCWRIITSVQLLWCSLVGRKINIAIGWVRAKPLSHWMVPSHTTISYDVTWEFP